MTQQNMQVDEFDLSDAPEMPTGVFTNYGKLSLTIKYGVWNKGALEEASRDDFKKSPAKVDGKNAKQIDMVFGINIQEFKPSLSFTYERKVTVEGLDWSKDNRNATLAKINGKYVAYQDVPQIPTKNKPERSNYNTFKLVKVFESREACHAEFVAANGTATSGSAPAPEANDPNVPSAYSREDWNSLKDAMVGEVDKAIADALAATKSKAPPVVSKARADAKTATLKKLAEEYEATPEQVLHLIS